MPRISRSSLEFTGSSTVQRRLPVPEDSCQCVGHDGTPVATFLDRPQIGPDFGRRKHTNHELIDRDCYSQSNSAITNNVVWISLFKSRLHGRRLIPLITINFRVRRYFTITANDRLTNVRVSMICTA